MNQRLPWWQQAAPEIDLRLMAKARQHQNQLTKPQGSLGELEDIAIRLACVQNQLHPQVEQLGITLFAGDHGVVAEGISAFPQSVTGEMLKNFARGGAAIAVLSRQLQAELTLVDTGTHLQQPLPGVVNCAIAQGTANFTQQAAMTAEQCDAALGLGKQFLDEQAERRTQLWLGGEMGIGNTTAASAIICALTEHPPELIVGPGTGLGAEGVKHKTRVIQRALDLHAEQLTNPQAVLQHLGGFEIAALSGAYIRAAQLRIAAVVDGFICGAAALVALRMNPSIAPYLLFSHRSAEPGHQLLLQALKVDPLLDLHLRLGEGSGAAITVPLIQMACKLHNEMASFASAGVSTKGTSD